MFLSPKYHLPKALRIIHQLGMRYNPTLCQLGTTCKYTSMLQQFGTRYTSTLCTKFTCQNKVQILFSDEKQSQNRQGSDKYQHNGSRQFHYSRSCQSNSKALILYDSIKDLKSSPLPALALGFSGLIPFAAAPAFMIYQQAFYSSIAFAQVAYGASILSFLGGVRWGFTLPEQSALQPNWTNMAISVMPSLVAWVGLLLPTPYSLLTVMTGLAAVGYYDIVTWGYPTWFKGLRFVLTFVAVLSLWTSFMCQYMLKSSENTSDDNSVKNE
ncbi:hypothetical protein FSP39_003555 [Pinctada imbricata]|uniref:Transmembrane protein 69 n=1 Tax=Pinctada imbricata TaxID=66713 RepID=A0AA88Y4N8_PINIB|nr:hypothetical protein FSP39_003555 [Pinctada imbricata]